MSREAAFWNWFIENREPFDTFEPGQDTVLDLLHDELLRYRDGLVFELSQPTEGIRELVISADGLRELFSAVEKLCGSAPAIPGWKITAFRPRMSLDSLLKFEGREFDPAEIWFHPMSEDGAFDLILYVPSFSEDERSAIVNGCYVLLDMALGERDVVTGIRYLDHHPLPIDPEAEGLLPFRTLPEVFDRALGRTR